jgi:hypothetical protein
MKFKFRILKDILRENQEAVFLPGHARAILLLSGGLTIEHATGSQWLMPDTGWTGSDEIVYFACKDGAELIRWEVGAKDEAHDGRLKSAPKATSELRQSVEIDLDPANGWLFRCDRVTFPAGTEAPWHMHQGPGLRYVISGSIDAIGPGGIRKLHQPGATFLENGVDEEVWAGMDPKVTTSFIRGLLLPRMLKSRPSTRIVKPEDWGVSRGQTYEVFSESYIELPAV